MNKGPPGNNRRFLKSRREDNSFNQHIHPENMLTSQGGKINSVKPRHSSDGNKQESKSNIKGKDGNFHGGKDGQIHVHHPQKENRSDAKRDHDRRKFQSFSKESANTRNFKPTTRNQSKGSEAPTNDEIRTRKQLNKNEKVVLKRSDNANMSLTPQHLKPAVHVQPLQQVPEKPDAIVQQNSTVLHTTDSNVCTVNQAGVERCQDVSDVDYANEADSQRSTSHQTLPEQATSTLGETISGKVEAPAQITDRKPVLHNPLMSPIFSSENQSLADLNTSGLGSYLSSSICTSFAPQHNLLKSQGDRSHESQPRAKQQILERSQNSFTIPRDQLDEAGSLPNIPDEKYGYRISVDSLFSTSFFSNPQTSVKSATSHPQHNDHSAKNKKCHDKSDRVKVVKNQKSNEELMLYNQVPHDHLLNEVQHFGAENPGNMKNNSNATQNNNPLAKNQKCIETTVLSSQVAHRQLLNEPLQLDAVNSNKTNNPPLLDYQPLTHSQDSYQKNENFDNGIVSPRRVKDPDKATLESPPPVLRNLVPHVGLQSGPVDTLIKDPSLSVEASSTRTYRNFAEQPKNGNERIPNGTMSSFSRENTTPRSSKADVTSKKEMVNNVVELNRGQTVQEPLVSVPITKNNSDVQTESLVNLNYREIPKQSSSLQTDGFPSSESKEPVSAYCSTNSDKTSSLTKVELQPTSTDEDEYGKNNPPLIDRNVEDNHVHQGAFPHGPFLPNPFLSHSLLTHRQAIPSAFVYPSRVGLPGGHSGFTDVAQHTGANPSSHIFPPHGTTVVLNVGGRIFEVLPSTFAPYPESLLYQIFTGAAPTPVNQRGHIFFDRDGYLFEIILAFARVGHLTLPPNVSLTALMNEGKFFGMYEYMFQKGQVSSRNMLQFQRTTHCTLHCDDSTKTSDTRVFVLQGNDKLKIESLHVTGPCYLFVDLYTPLGVKETSNFVMYTPDKPDLWKAYQFCAERQLVFHLERADSTADKSSVEIVFAQTFVFAGDEFVFNL